MPLPVPQRPPPLSNTEGLHLDLEEMVVHSVERLCGVKLFTVHSVSMIIREVLEVSDLEKLRGRKAARDGLPAVFEQSC